MALRARSYRSDHQIPKLAKASAPECRVAAKRAAEAAAATAADRSRARGDHGGVSSLTTFWDFTITDLDALPLDAVLRPHIPRDAIDKAVRAYVKAGGRELDGARIFENTKSVVR